MSAWKTKTSVDLMPNASIQFHIIPAFVIMDSFPLLEWNAFPTVTTLHAEILMTVKREMFVDKMQHASTHQAVFTVSVMLALDYNLADLTSLAVRSNVKTYV